MPTISEPKGNEPRPQLVSPPVVTLPPERELFAAEIEMEKQSSNIFPLLLIFGLIIVVGGTIYYFVKGARDVLTTQAATASVNKILASQSAATLRFTTGTVTSSVNEKPLDPHYKLLAKAGIVTTKPQDGAALIVELTGPGQNLLGGITDIQKSKNADGTTSYLVPLAARGLVSIDKITMIRPHLAQVDYTWKWQPNRLGEEFDASSSLVKSFSSWDRATLIKSYGVDFYSAPPTKASAVLMEANDGTWKPYTE
jgi:hypothetical protein